MSGQESHYIQQELLNIKSNDTESSLILKSWSSTKSSSPSNAFPSQHKLRLAILGQDKIQRANFSMDYMNLFKLVNLIKINCGPEFQEAKTLCTEGEMLTYEQINKTYKTYVYFNFKKKITNGKSVSVVVIEISDKTKGKITLHLNDFYGLMVFLKDYLSNFQVISSNMATLCQNTKLVDVMTKNLEEQKVIVTKLTSLGKLVSPDPKNKKKKSVENYSEEIKDIEISDDCDDTVVVEDLDPSKQSLPENIVNFKNKNEIGLDSPFIGTALQNNSEKLYDIVEKFKKLKKTSNDNLFTPLEYLFKLSSIDKSEYEFLMGDDFYNSQFYSTICLYNNMLNIEKDPSFTKFGYPRYKFKKCITPDNIKLWEFTKESVITASILEYIVYNHYIQTDTDCNDEKFIMTFILNCNFHLMASIKDEFKEQFVSELESTLTRVLESNFTKYFKMKFSLASIGNTINFDYSRILVNIEGWCDKVFNNEDSIVCSYNFLKRFCDKTDCRAEMVDCDNVEEIKHFFFRFVELQNKPEQEIKSLSFN